MRGYTLSALFGLSYSLAVSLEANLNDITAKCYKIVRIQNEI